MLFGGVSAPGRRRAVSAVNALAGQDVLEVGVGTGLALPHYLPSKRVTGIDLSTDMLERARSRVQREHLANVVALQEGDAEATGFADDQFDIAVAMFVASVVPNPRRLLTEMRRVVKPAALFCSSTISRPPGVRGWRSSVQWRPLAARSAGIRTSRPRPCCRRRTWCARSACRCRRWGFSP